MSRITEISGVLCHDIDNLLIGAPVSSRRWWVWTERMERETITTRHSIARELASFDAAFS